MRNRLLISVLVGISPVLASAQPGDTAEDKTRFGELDVDVDGSISPDELEADFLLKPHFSEMDSDHDGSISTGEFSKFEESSDRKVIDDDRGIRTDSERGRFNNRAENTFGMRLI